MRLKSSASTAFDDAFERAVIWRFEAMSKEMSALAGDMSPDIGRSELDATREGIALARECGIKIECELDKVKPGLLGTIFSPGLESDNWDSHQEAQRKRVKQAIEDVYDDIEACMTKAARRLVGLAADEYGEGLRRLINGQENPADARRIEFNGWRFCISFDQLILNPAVEGVVGANSFAHNSLTVRMNSHLRKPHNGRF